jgi:carboxyl-terminal processing protease
MTENHNKGSNKRTLCIVLSIVFLCLSFSAGFITSCFISGKKSSIASKLLYMMDKVGCIYDPVTGELREITEEDVADALVNGLLDEYSFYYTEEEYKNILQNDKGNYKGFGVAFYKVDDNKFDIIIGNSPLDRAGVRSGDIFVSGKVDGKEKVQLNNATELIRFFASCSENSVVTIDCLRGSVPFSVEVKKEKFIASYVSYYDNEKSYRFLSDGGAFPQGVEGQNDLLNITDTAVAYIKLDSFEGDAAWQIGQSLKFMKERGKTKLILDLRGNGGGLMSVLTNVAEYFINNGGKNKSLVAYAKGKQKSESFYTNDNKFQSFLSEVAVIGDENTASASECLIGALVYYGACDISNVVVEENSLGKASTYGKGIMQTTYQFLSGDAFKLTTARILWPDKTTCIHKKGVTPDMGATPSAKGNGFNVALSLLG